MPPMKVARIATTMARIGRSMKACVNFMACPLFWFERPATGPRLLALRGLPRRWQVGDLRFHHRPRTHPRQAVDDHRVVAGQAAADHTVAVDARTDLHRPRHRLLVLAND